MHENSICFLIYLYKYFQAIVTGKLNSPPKHLHFLLLFSTFFSDFPSKTKQNTTRHSAHSFLAITEYASELNYDSEPNQGMIHKIKKYTK